MKNLKRVAALMTTMVVTSLLGATAAQAAPVQVQATWDCPASVSCYWSDANGSGTRWIAPSAGCHDLFRISPQFHDRISSAWNRGNGSVIMYNYLSDDLPLQPIVTLPVGQAVSFSATDPRNDKIDILCIA